MSDDALVQHAINDYYTPLQRGRLRQVRRGELCGRPECGGFLAEDTFVTDNLQSMADNGQIMIPEITDLTVDGDRATARVHWHFEKSADKKNVVGTTVVREDGKWKVCTQ